MFLTRRHTVSEIEYTAIPTQDPTSQPDILTTSRDTEPQRSFVHTLPLELVCLILSAIPDPESLFSVILSCNYFYQAFNHAESTIVHHVMMNQIGPDNLPEAITAFRSAELPPPDFENEQTAVAFSEFLQENVHKRPSLETWSLTTALALSEIHDHVNYFATRFIAETSGNGPIRTTKTPRTTQEINRFRRAFYRFETFSNFFHTLYGTIWFSVRDFERQFMSPFAPWEIDQIACAHDFLGRTILPAFNDVAEHDVGFGEMNIEFGNTVQIPGIQYLLTLGLEELRLFATTSTYEERCELLARHVDSLSDMPILCDILALGYTGQNANNCTLREVMQKGIDSECIRTPLFHDNDPGPRDIWQWAYWEETGRKWVYQENREDLLRWGYVLWDKARLDESRIFQRPWKDPYTPEKIANREYEASCQRDIMEKSWTQRERVCRLGGRGWWDFGNESEVQWKVRRQGKGRSWSVTSNCSMYYISSSLEGARDQLETMELPWEEEEQFWLP
ncbi:hypothetical protein NLU13_4159 [Sarocladium strictum]|uniref:F-box domain-containing protein n=1 Tax=Sarocladium strictum TaxID=5046 RepID=A0AA39GJ56_SARSR|nr:hypothetical protein NLU13_4159 [Sarocladium strictum]